MKYFLYVKTSPKGLKYLGKTTKDPYKYMGSGKIWKRHIKKHNLTKDDIITEILLKTDDEGRLIEEGLIYSDKFNVVESDEWANLRSENGDGGDTSKFIDYNKPGYRDSRSSKHLNEWLKNVSDDERKRILRERISKVDFAERDRKTKENTDWDSWRESIKNRVINYNDFLGKVHENNKKPIYQLDMDDNIINEYKSSKDAAEILCINVGGICNCLRGRTKSSGGFKWKYK
ncbi:MAG: NUMOD1 domain-containing DNA-binding protein [Candidatus Kariarchaeum pelagius]